MPIPGATALGAWTAPTRTRVAGRQQPADVASLAPLLAPWSVAVIGASRRAGSIGWTILITFATAGFAGVLFAVNRTRRTIEGAPCLPSVSRPAHRARPRGRGLGVPPAQVSKVARECGKRVRSLVVITSGLGVSWDAHLLDTCRQYGMRLVGPNCFGVAVPGLGWTPPSPSAIPGPVPRAWWRSQAGWASPCWSTSPPRYRYLLVRLGGRTRWMCPATTC